MGIPLRDDFDGAVGRVIILGRQQFIANQAIDPLVGDKDFELIVAVPSGASDVHAVRRFPQQAEVFAIQANLRQHVHPAQVQE